jgi:hypothetical protein
MQQIFNLLFEGAFSVPATVTLYNVQATPAGFENSFNATLKYSDTVSAVGVGSDGMTTYSENIVVSAEILVESSSTLTVTDSRVQTTIMGEFSYLISISLVTYSVFLRRNRC